MGTDIWAVLQWWGALFVIGAAAWPLTGRLFFSWFDHGYLFSKAIGMATATWIVYVIASLRIFPFTPMLIILSLLLVLEIGLILHILNYELRMVNYEKNKNQWKLLSVMVAEELFFLGVLLFWSWIKGHEPSIRGLEKFMDYGFMKSILESRYFPPGDMWYSPLSINYYYFGHMVTAVLTKLSGLDLAVTFNLMLSSLFSLTATMAFSIGVQLFLLSKQMNSESGIMNHEKNKNISIHNLVFSILSGLLTSFLVTLAGNMQTIYAFTRGYTGDNVKPFWELAWPIAELWKRLPEGFNTYWYANATRFIPYSIHEFPSYSFVVSDVHGHVLSIPFVLLAIALLIQLSAITHQQSAWLEAGSWKLNAIFYGFLVGVLLMTNALDGPIYFALLVVAYMSYKTYKSYKTYMATMGMVAFIAVVTSLPFLFHFKSFVTGLAVNCPPGSASWRIGPLLFEGIEKCQRSPLWMLWILWGFFAYCGGWLIYAIGGIRKIREIGAIEKLLVVFFFFSLALIIFPEFFYFKDIYPMHFRSNTMFKLGYQAFILFSIVAGYTIVRLFRNKLFLIFLLPQLFLVSIFPIFSVRSYFNSLRQYQGLSGFAWMQLQYPDDWAGIEWIKSQISGPTSLSARGATMTGIPVIVEADGDSYTDYARFSAFTGMPTVIGWPVHEWLWRGGYDVVGPRREDVRQIYESSDAAFTRSLLGKYTVRYVIVGALERQKYERLQEWKFGTIGTKAFQQGATVIYEMKGF
ncbi:hypothetical protein HY948_04265 [Candidatus Gottesmanbacteria bacterium]|nr:hypothetical protein [Candidatus Gottesmanbacteria bacterium]